MASPSPKHQRIALTEEQKRILLDDRNLPSSIEVGGREYVPQKAVAAGFKGAVWKVKDSYGRTRAAKLTIHQDYEERSYLQELSWAARLEPYDEVARFIDADYVEIDLPEVGRQTFVCFIEEWIEGTTLHSYLKDSDDVSVSFFLAYVEHMCRALKALKTVGLRHDDLHSDNVMLARAAPGQDDIAWRARIIDTGSLKLFSTPTKKERDDHTHFVGHLVEIYNCLHQRRQLNIREHRFLKSCRELLRLMLDEDPSVALRDPDEIRKQFKLAHVRASSIHVEQDLSMRSPFEYISAEHIADDRILVEIFAESCPWLEKVAGPDPCLITGPRGCGKSTIFRWLSLKAHLHKPATELREFRVAGFYISCSSDLQNRVGWVSTPTLADKFQKELIHYFNLFLAREVVQTLCMISERADREEFWGLGSAQENGICHFLRENLQVEAPGMRGMSKLWQALEMLERELFRCQVEMLKGQNISWATPESFLSDFTQLLTREIDFFRERRIAFLVDDFSTHRLPSAVQSKLNRVIWERRSSHIFKLSSEKHGAILRDSHEATIDVSREMVEIDCGREYVALDDRAQVGKARRFAVDLLANRLRAANYGATPQELLGDSNWSENSLGRALRAKKNHRGRINDQYHGIECIADLCSGDISTLLLVYRRIFEKGSVTSDTRTVVPKHIQHDAIESVSRELLEAIQHHYPYGKEMHWIVSEFGRLVRRILDDGRCIRQGESEVPPMCPRIEVDQDHRAPDDRLADTSQQIALELIRRAIFIEMEPGRSRHKFVPTVRWQIRRVYLPAFGAALQKNDALKWGTAQFKYFLTNPQEACELAWERRQKDPSADDPKLFDEVH